MATSERSPSKHSPGPEASGPIGLRVSGIMDHAILDRHGHRAGRVDDLLFDVRKHDHGPIRLVLRDLVSGPLPRRAHGWIGAVRRLCYRAMGVAAAHPTRIAWSHVLKVDAMIYLDVDRQTAQLRVVDDALQRWVGKIPRARVKP